MIELDERKEIHKRLLATICSHRDIVMNLEYQLFMNARDNTDPDHRATFREKLLNKRSEQRKMIKEVREQAFLNITEIGNQEYMIRIRYKRMKRRALVSILTEPIHALYAQLMWTLNPNGSNIYE